jgi:hypothetical protein
VRTDFFAYGERVLLERSKRFRPRFAAMDIGAIGQMQAVVQLHGWVCGWFESGGVMRKDEGEKIFLQSAKRR